jgi:two-component system NtrC family sensor kinase
MRFDILITDIELPGISGVVLAEEVRRRCPDMGIIYSTGYEGSECPAGTLKLQKPYDRGALENILSQFVRTTTARFK